jgi:predicted Ser/Thr protein kinase
MSANLITFVYPIEKSCAINIDFEGHEYLLRWDGDWRKLPSLESFPVVNDAAVTLIPHSPSVHDIWSRSQVLTYGADSHVRILNSCTDGFPICKIAIDDRQRRLIQEEFSILRELSSHDVPAVRVHEEPLQDDEGIFGFRMEELVKLNRDTRAKHISGIEKAFERLHQLSIVHNDISPSNLMLNRQGEVRVIDFGRAGHAGMEIPAYKTNNPNVQDQKDFSIENDNRKVQQVVGTFNHLVKNLSDS